MSNILQIKEFSTFTCTDLPKNNRAIVYQELEDIAKSDNGKDILGFTRNGTALQARNYVGTVQTKSGFVLEILPKIYDAKDISSIEKTKDIFLKLLQILYKLPSYKQINNVHLATRKKPLLEIFIEMFIIEIEKLLKKGLKSDYSTKEENLHYLKGKLNIKENIKRNAIHKERFYVEYDLYNQNRPENRLLKTTLLFLLQRSIFNKNVKKLRILIYHFDNVEPSYNIKKDFSKIKIDKRGMEHYRQALIWAKIFLQQDSFCSFSGKTTAFAILYPMEKLFENYVAHILQQKYKRCSQIQIIAQSYTRGFVQGLFGVRPDILIEHRKQIIIVADAKWKIVNPTDPQTLSQSDFYQLFAYSKVYKINRLRLYYPMHQYFTKLKKFAYFNGAEISLIPVDLKKILEKESL